jgi:hypothetical protein
MDSPSQENNTPETTSPELRLEPEEAAVQETADAKRGIQWREIIRQAFDKARQTQQPTASRRELSKDKSKSLIVLGGRRGARAASAISGHIFFASEGNKV